jgi:hypothetical protein
VHAAKLRFIVKIYAFITFMFFTDSIIFLTFDTPSEKVMGLVTRGSIVAKASSAASRVL